MGRVGKEFILQPVNCLETVIYFLLAADLFSLRPYYRADRANYDQNTKCSEPPGLPPGRTDVDLHRSSGFVPDPVVATGFNPESITTRIQIGIGNIAPGAGIDPILIETFHLIGILILFGENIIKRGKFK